MSFKASSGLTEPLTLVRANEVMVLAAGSLARCVITALVIFLPLRLSSLSFGIADNVFLIASGAMDWPASMVSLVTAAGSRSHASIRSRQQGPSNTYQIGVCHGS